MNGAVYSTRRILYDLSKDTHFFNTLFQTPYFGIVITDLAGIILEVNSAAEKKISNAKRGNNFFALCTVESGDNETFFEGQSISDHFNFLLKVEENTYSVFRLKQRSDLYVWIITLTSDERSNEQARASLIQKNEDLAKVNAQMEKFLYSTSHDLRSPLTSILGLVNLIRLERPSSIIDSYLDKIEAVSGRFDLIIKNIIGFSRNSYQRVQTKKIALKELIDRIIDNYKNLPHFKRIHFDVVVHDNGIFYSDQSRLEIALGNIIQNAIVFTDENKCRPFVTISAITNNNGVTLQIMDNGIGIGQSHLNQIFNMFYRATERAHGAGLGLYVAKEAINRLNGTVTVESEIGFGSIFNIHIPNDPKGKLVNKKLRLQEGIV